jgi:hypothetical protein
MRVELMDASSSLDGMVGFNSIFISTKLFYEFSTNILTARIVGLLFHEGSHYINRFLNNNLLWITPPRELKSNTLQPPK